MIHKFSMNGYNMVLDVDGGSEICRLYYSCGRLFESSGGTADGGCL